MIIAEQDRLSTEAVDYARIIDGRLREAVDDLRVIHDLIPRSGELNRRRHEMIRVFDLIEMAREDLAAVTHRVDALATQADQLQTEADETWFVLDAVMNFLAGSGRVKHDPELRHLLDNVYPKWGDHA